MADKYDVKRELPCYSASRGRFEVIDVPELNYCMAKAPAAEQVRFERLAEGRSVQTLHLGSYDHEGPTLARLHDECMPEHGFRFDGRHHEVYLGDPRRTAPEKLRTIIRQPVAPA